MRTTSIVTVVLLALAVAAGCAVAGCGDGAAAAVAETTGGPVAGLAAQPTRAERRCRSVARHRLMRLRKAARAKGRARVAASDRRRVRRKLRRCLRDAALPKDPAGAPGEAPGDGTGTPTTPAAPPLPLPSFVGVTASDSDGFRLTLSRPAVAAGQVTVELRNVDSGPHDLVVRPEGGGPVAAQFGEAEPGAVVRQQANLPKGRWYLYCSLPGHEVSGMYATLRAE